MQLLNRESTLDNYSYYSLKKYIEDCVSNNRQDQTRLDENSNFYEIIILTEKEKEHFKEYIIEMCEYYSDYDQIVVAMILSNDNNDYTQLLIADIKDYQILVRSSSLIN